MSRSTRIRALARHVDEPRADDMAGRLAPRLREGSEAHSLARVQIWPVSLRQLPAPSQELAPLQMFAGKLSSVNCGMFEHTPSEPAILHALHAPLHALLQQ